MAQHFISWAILVGPLENACSRAKSLWSATQPVAAEPRSVEEPSLSKDMSAGALAIARKAGRAQSGGKLGSCRGFCCERGRWGDAGWPPKGGARLCVRGITTCWGSLAE